MASAEKPVTTVEEAFLAAARFAGEVISQPAIGKAWRQPSVLPEMTVGDVAGHVFLVIRRVDQHLDEDAASLAHQPGEMSFPRVSAPEDLAHEVHVTVRVDGRHVAAWGWPDVRDAYNSRVAKVSARLEQDTPQSVVVGDRSIDFADYLGSRVVELLVHADDLLASTRIDDWHPPEQALDAALSYLLTAARLVHGDRQVLRAFSRSERTPPGVPSVY